MVVLYMIYGVYMACQQVLVLDRSCVEFDFFPTLYLDLPGADEKLAELIKQVVKMVEHQPDQIFKILCDTLHLSLFFSNYLSN